MKKYGMIFSSTIVYNIGMFGRKGSTTDDTFNQTPTKAHESYRCAYTREEAADQDKVPAHDLQQASTKGMATCCATS
jgi:hypothetical protein